MATCEDIFNFLLNKSGLFTSNMNISIMSQGVEIYISTFLVKNASKY